MKLITALLLTLPLTVMAAEHGGAPADAAKPAAEAAKATTDKTKEAADAAADGKEHGGAPAEKKP